MLALIGLISSLNFIVLPGERIDAILESLVRTEQVSPQKPSTPTQVVAPQVLTKPTSNPSIDKPTDSNRVGIFSTGKFKRPLIDYIVSSEYGEWRGTHSHSGIDLAAPTGTLVYAADGGVVIISEYYGAYGNLIVIDHENGFTTYYSHLSALGTKVGTRLPKGRGIGWVGSTGRSSGPHLHFEIRKDGEPREPRNYIRF
jgi:murein DD-endopeptidase MepM/ murein hydrolase activator NlpD